jgi:protein-S-isoprenylcysteine O-methyltransferase Ste14
MRVRWKGEQGEWYVAIQMLLFALLVFGPQNTTLLPIWPEKLASVSVTIGGLLIAIGLLITALAAIQLGTNLTPLPHPKPDAHLVISGLYRQVRHPIYTGIIFASTGWAVFTQGWLTLAYATTLFLFFDIKSRREEVWLLKRFPEYAEYRQHVRKLIPFIY